MNRGRGERWIEKKNDALVPCNSRERISINPDLLIFWFSANIQIAHNKCAHRIWLMRRHSLIGIIFSMKKDIHPKYYSEGKATCACGALFAVGSTKPELTVEICSNCHPFYTGADKVVDTAGRVERFKAKTAKAAAKKTAVGSKKS